MSKNVTKPSSCIDKYIEKNRKGYKISTYNQYRTVLRKITKDLEDNGYDASPAHVTEDAVRFLLDVQWKDLEVATKKWQAHMLSRYLQYYGNTVMAEMDIRWPQDMRPNVDWLTDMEQYRLLNADLSPKEQIVIHLELNLGLRIAEVCNLKMDYIDYKARTIDVLGKGRGDGKWRTVPFSSDTEVVLWRWLDERSRIVKRVRDYDPDWQDPGNLLLWCHYIGRPHAAAYSARGHSLDRGVIHVVRKRLRLSFTNIP